MNDNFLRDELAEGRLVYQCCKTCGHLWLPERESCPSCLAPAVEFREASGQGTILSWVTYHHAYSEIVKDLVPYSVAIVRLDEGPQLLANMTEPDIPVIGGRVCFVASQTGKPAHYWFRTITEVEA